MTRLIQAVFFCLLAGGCSALNVQKPQAAITGMTVQAVDAAGFTMNFDVNVTNPNAVALPLGAADYKVNLADVNVASGNAAPHDSIPAGGSKRIALPVKLTYENLLAAEQGIAKSGGNVPYSFDGALSFNAGSALLGSVRVPLQFNGTLAMREILSNPQTILQSPAARKLAKDLMGGLFGL